MLRVFDDRNAAAAGADHRDTVLEQQPNCSRLHDTLRLWRSDGSPPSGTVAGNAPISRQGKLLGLGFFVDRADRLVGRLERRIVAIDHRLRQQRCHRAVRRQQLRQLLLDQIADHALGLGAEHIQRPRFAHRRLHGLQRQQADLRAVAMRDHQGVPADEGRQCHCGVVHMRALLHHGRELAPLQQGVATQGDDEPHRLNSRASRRGSP